MNGEMLAVGLDPESKSGGWQFGVFGLLNIFILLLLGGAFAGSGSNTRERITAIPSLVGGFFAWIGLVVGGALGVIVQLIIFAGLIGLIIFGLQQL